ncbi:ABC transporter permease [Haloglycomyces albus]|uniref:ABC transporter permease n=1 Tax=Haloglycomyces albus TaxID=526067 RepID=UPI00046D8BFE|nr:ABC transporter permease [Haloglycomyces albus]
MNTATPPRPKRMPAPDVIRTGAEGLYTRPLRAFLSAIGIAIGIAAVVAVVGISASSKAEVEQRLQTLGTNLLTAEPGTNLFGKPGVLPADAAGMAKRHGLIDDAASVGQAVGAKAYRSDKIPEQETNGLSVYGTDLNLLDVIGGDLRAGTWLNEATGSYPAVVLGASAADRLGIGAVQPDTSVVIDGETYSVIGILDRNELAPELDGALLMGWDSAEEAFDLERNPSRLYVEADPDHVVDVRDILADAINPSDPVGTEVSRPSDALAAQEATDDALTAMLLGLGGVSLLVGGVGVANTMVISVLERRSEIGLRRALGATRGRVRLQFITESLLLSVLGGIGGAALGAGATAAFALAQGWPITVPPWAIGAGLGATVVIGAFAGFYPAMRAARLPPTEALAAS